MRALEANMTSTAEPLIEFDTVNSGDFNTKNKNNKIISLINNKMQQNRDSSESMENWGGQYFDNEQQWALITDDLQDSEEYQRIKSSIREAIELYINMNKFSALKEINEWLVKEYIVCDSIDLLHSLVDIGEEIFKDARPRNELEAKSINAFIRSKAKTILIE